MVINQYVPAFVTGVDLVTEEFETESELREISFVKKHINSQGHLRLSLTKNGCLMNELREKGGEVSWWVVGYISGGRPELPLAIFEQEEFKAQRLAKYLKEGNKP